MSVRRLACAAFVTALALPHALPGQAWESKMISSGPNRPRLPIGMAPWREALIGLRHGGMVPADSVIADLITEGVAARVGARVAPTCFIANRADGERLDRHAAATAAAFLPTLRTHIATLRQALARDPIVDGVPEGDLALLLYSNVLLDNWQISGVEAEWLGEDRPLRAGGRYYCAALERDPASRVEPFGIWGNASRSTASWRVGVYGNDRGAPGLHSVRASELATSLGLDTTTIAADDRMEAALTALVAAHRDASSDTAYAAVAQRLGFWHAGRSTLLVLPAGASERFAALAAALRPELVAFLTSQDASLAQVQRDLGYAALTAAEFRIWWYHFFYSALTRELVSTGIIPADQSDRATYLFPR